MNVHQLDAFEDNYKSYQKVFNDFGLKNLVLFARKANKCKALVEAARDLGFGVDTASIRELQECIELSVPSDKLVLTAAVKNEELIEVAIECNVLIILDNMDEIKLIQKVAERKSKVAKVGFRVSGFHFEGEKLYSRFGFDIDEILDMWKTNFKLKGRFSNLNIQGLHFHLNGYSTTQRGVAFLACLKLIKQFRENGLSCKFIDIGGGFLMRYLESKEQWYTFEEQLIEAVKGNRPPITFQNTGLGYEIINGNLQRNMKVYPYYNENAKAAFLRAILNFKDNRGNAVSTLVKELDLEIRMEPGRSMLDQVGITIAKVAFRKKDMNGDWLVGLEMNMTQMHSSSADFLLDPIVVFQHPNHSENSEVGVFFTGAYCLERDVLLKRKIALSQLPEVGDIVIFINTAGYMMHFFESEAHLFALAKNLILERGSSDLQLENFRLDR